MYLEFFINYKNILLTFFFTDNQVQNSINLYILQQKDDIPKI